MNIADRFPEPEDGTRLVIELRDKTLVAIWRNDEQAATDETVEEGERWFEFSPFGGHSDPYTWRRSLELAAAIYPIGDVPLVAS